MIDRIVQVLISILLIIIVFKITNIQDELLVVDENVCQIQQTKMIIYP